MTDQTETTENQGRRRFLKLAATGAPAAAVAAATGTGAAQAEPAEEPQSGLADTAQTRAYYSSARF